MITQDELKRCFDYDPETGIFIWKIKPNKKLPIGTIAGATVNQYKRITYKGKSYGAHRLAWLYMYGTFPANLIDHINGNGLDNRIANLREATSFENAQNITKAQKNNPHGYLGVTFDKRKQRWRARIGVDGTRRRLGSFKTPEEAYNAYLSAKRELHPFNTM
jgi:hypothetical protein